MQPPGTPLLAHLTPFGLGPVVSVPHPSRTLSKPKSLNYDPTRSDCSPWPCSPLAVSPSPSPSPSSSSSQSCPSHQCQTKVIHYRPDHGFPPAAHFSILAETPAVRLIPPCAPRVAPPVCRLRGPAGELDGASTKHLRYPVLDLQLACSRQRTTDSRQQTADSRQHALTGTCRPRASLPTGAGPSLGVIRFESTYLVAGTIYTITPALVDQTSSSMRPASRHHVFAFGRVPSRA